MKIGTSLVILIFVAGLAVFFGSAYTLDEGHQAVITRFGRPVGQTSEAGLHFRTPFVEKVHKIEKRLLPWDGEPENMQTRDKKRIFIDVWARWRISDPMQFFQAVRTQNRGNSILNDLLDSSVRNVIGRYNLIEAVRSTNDPLVYESDELTAERAAKREKIVVGRAKLEAEILEATQAELAANNYGIELADVHIKRVNYIESVRNTVYERMKSERDRIARLFESEAEEEQNRILGQTRKEVDEIEGEMEQRSAEIRGDADAEVIKIFADAIEKSPEFYKFIRRLEAYRKVLGKNTRLILSTDSDFLRLLNAMEPSNDARAD